ncbi:MAG: hypothetical protein WBQ43_05150 [Terriglobales bacterium]
MQNQEQFLALLRGALENIREPRFFHTERGFQGELLAQLRNRLQDAELPGDPIVEQEYQKTIPVHGLNIRPDIIVHIPFERGRADHRDQGNFVAMELKLRSTENEARGDFANLEQMKRELGYPLTIFINIDSDETYADLCPEGIAGQTVCYAVRLEDGNPSVCAVVLVPPARNDG